MNKDIWIINHYMTNSLFEGGGRHLWIAKFLKLNGYNPIIICASTIHNSNDIINTNNKKFIVQEHHGINYVIVKASSYSGNGFSRIMNLYTFYRNLLISYKKIIKQLYPPNIIYSSSPHLLTLIAGIKITRKLKIKCISEIRDLWPESFVAYGIIGQKSIITKLLYLCEKWIYKKSDHIVMTLAGGYDYIVDKGWNKSIQREKISYINNGIDLKQFYDNSRIYEINDADLNNTNNFICVYTGSIRKVNNLSILLDTAKIILNNGYYDIKFIIYGSGDEEEELKSRCKEESITNVMFKGKVNKKYIPSILMKASINILHNKKTNINKYGQSQNKLFEYFAAGKAVLQTYSHRHSIIEEFDCGICCNEQTPMEIAEKIVFLQNNELLRNTYEKNAAIASRSFDFETLTNKLIYLIENKL